MSAGLALALGLAFWALIVLFVLALCACAAGRPVLGDTPSRSGEQRGAAGHALGAHLESARQH